MRRPTIEQWTDDDHLMLLTSWMRRGLTYKEVASNMGISSMTLQRWRKLSKILGDTLNISRDIAVSHVENALYKSALGFRYREQSVTNKGEVVWVEKYEKPSIAAQIFYLKNRRPELWSDRKEVTHAASVPDKDIIVKWGGQLLDRNKE